jgi:hypothetical protein
MVTILILIIAIICAFCYGVYIGASESAKKVDKAINESWLSYKDKQEVKAKIKKYIKGESV